MTGIFIGPVAKNSRERDFLLHVFWWTAVGFLPVDTVPDRITPSSSLFWQKRECFYRTKSSFALVAEENHRWGLNWDGKYDSSTNFCWKKQYMDIGKTAMKHYKHWGFVVVKFEEKHILVPPIEWANCLLLTHILDGGGKPVKTRLSKLWMSKHKKGITNTNRLRNSSATFYRMEGKRNRINLTTEPLTLYGDPIPLTRPNITLQQNCTE